MPISPCHFTISPKCQQKVLGPEELAALATQQIIQCGSCLAIEEFSISRPNPDFVTLLFTFSGKGQLHTKDHDYELEPGSLLIIPNNFANRIELADKEWQLAWMMMQPDAPLVKGIKQQVQLLYMPYGELLKNCIDGLVLTQGLSALSHSKIQPLLIAQMIQVLTASLADQSAHDRQALRLRQVFEQVEQKLDHNWSVEEMARLAHFSSPHFHRLCKQYYQSSPLQQVIKLRMNQAKRLLSGTDWPIQDIAELVGYSELTNFSTRFRKLHGLSPTGFRKQHTSFDTSTLATAQSS
ncbi:MULTISPECIES: AraC family transcriptional regulator [unclassified Motilimonas]|uniref:AraC family transcriptional regulator n=1 Tax=unclassified Motilimonas TaxID=2643697 RepID=UPI001E2C4D24|nr:MULTISPECIES: AraC family transcriptional regulator [unclassified Motilimonas]MCE0555716.1 AraC family transcriptional regulator [Motilimonas sp. E26]MDO6524234.1 AraC family transcriptional regulator [Motilimonas sp. 1_MG-2023]